MPKSEQKFRLGIHPPKQKCLNIIRFQVASSTGFSHVDDQYQHKMKEPVLAASNVSHRKYIQEFTHKQTTIQPKK